MKIRPDDQLVLLNGTFLPDDDHSAVLRLFSDVPMDSRTRLSLVLLRHISKKKWIWLNTSVILVPKYDSETAGRDPDFHESYVNPRKERHLIRLKVSGTCLFIAIADGHASLEVSKLAKDVDKFNITVWVRCGLDPRSGRLSYTACIYKERHNIQNDYLTIEYEPTGKVECILKPEQQWFGFDLRGGYMFFKDTKLKKWLSCNVSNDGASGTFGLSDQPYHFESYPVHLGAREDSESHESLDNISIKGTGYGHSMRSSCAL